MLLFANPLRPDDPGIVLAVVGCAVEVSEGGCRLSTGSEYAGVVIPDVLRRTEVECAGGVPLERFRILLEKNTGYSSGIGAKWLCWSEDESEGRDGGKGKGMRRGKRGKRRQREEESEEGGRGVGVV